MREILPPTRRVAKKVLLATHGGLSLELCAVIENVCPMAIYRLVCCIGRTCLVKLATRCHLPLPQYFIADEKHSHCLDKRVYLPTIGCGRVIWHLGYTTSKSVDAFANSYGEFQQAAKAIDPFYQVKGILTDGFNSTKKSLGQLFPLAKLANCMLHATFKLPAQIQGVTKAVRQTLCSQFRGIFFVNNARKTPNNRSLSQRLRRFVEQVHSLAGEDNGERVRRWISRKKAGWHVGPRRWAIGCPTCSLYRSSMTIKLKLTLKCQPRKSNPVVDAVSFVFF